MTLLELVVTRFCRMFKSSEFLLAIVSAPRISTLFQFGLVGFSSRWTAFLMLQSIEFAFKFLMYATLFNVTFLFIVRLAFFSVSIKCTKLILLIFSV